MEHQAVKHFGHDLSDEEIRGIAGDSPVMLEIGSHEGADTVKFLAAMPGIRLYCFVGSVRCV